ncbi:MAG: hypothetical protein ACE14T_03830 [Syntrophales bacterium]
MPGKKSAAAYSELMLIEIAGDVKFGIHPPNENRWQVEEVESGIISDPRIIPLSHPLNNFSNHRPTAIPWCWAGRLTYSCLLTDGF